MQAVIDMPEGAGPCAKQTVTATVIAKDGTRYISTNYTMNPQQSCPRAEMPTGVGYHLCKVVCAQPAHAEVNALRIAGDSARGAHMIIEGHTYACEHCARAAADAGVARINFL